MLDFSQSRVEPAIKRLPRNAQQTRAFSAAGRFARHARIADANELSARFDGDGLRSSCRTNCLHLMAAGLPAVDKARR
jgi:hypothetical protein